jgi:hypothetical protein
MFVESPGIGIEPIPLRRATTSPSRGGPEDKTGETTASNWWAGNQVS